MSEEEDMRTALQRMQLRGDQITDESLESTRRMVGYAQESQEAGTKTLVALDMQGEQLDKIEQGMDKINTDMRDAERNLTNLQKCCGLCVMPWRRAKNYERTDEYKIAFERSEDSGVDKKGANRVAVTDAKHPTAQGGYVHRIANDAREDEMEENLSQVHELVGNLKNMAIDMGNELDTQNKQIDRINDKAGALDQRILNANRTANKIIRDQ